MYVWKYVSHRVKFTNALKIQSTLVFNARGRIFARYFMKITSISIRPRLFPEVSYQFVIHTLSSFALNRSIVIQVVSDNFTYFERYQSPRIKLKLFRESNRERTRGRESRLSPFSPSEMNLSTLRFPLHISRYNSPGH